MQDSTHFLTIGQLSKFTGVHVKALRYYERIGILTPAYVNPENGYRYYSHSHIPYVSVIRLCANYGLPLKEFHDFILSDEQVDIAAIIQRVQKSIAEQEKKLQADKHYLQQFNEQLQISKQVDAKLKFHIETGNEDYFLLPFEGEILSDDYYLAVQKALTTISQLRMHFDNRLGCFYHFNGQQLQVFLACKIKECQEDRDSDSILCLKHTHTHAEHIDKDKISDKINELYQNKHMKDFLVLETFENPYKLVQPHLEIRYFLENAHSST